MRVGFIAAVIIVIAACFAWTGGWFARDRVDQQRILDAFESANGIHPGFRRNHAKGVCLAGVFESNGAGAQYSKARIFEPGRVPVFGRFALAGSLPMAADGPGAVRSMALNFTLPDGEAWRTGMNDIPVFPVKDPQGFYDQLVATRPDPRTGKPDAQRVDAFLSAHPEAARAQAIIRAHGFSSGFADATYNSLDAFRLVDRNGHSTPVRWSMVPVDAFQPEPANPPDDKNYLFDALMARVQRGPVQWHLVLTLGQPGDPTDDATVQWPNDRRHVDVGILTVTQIDTEAAGNCRDVNFDPLVLPDGIAPSDDPLLSARSATYALGFTRRAGEVKTPSAVQVGQGL
ncbi:MAG TPA: catalase family peroxidase [Casimicrobiaceae bacterium]|nr:catalase family peroxidase [Casimicrobiaceae bacterium]